MITKTELQNIKTDIKAIVENTEDGKVIELCGVIVRTKKGIDVRQLKNVAQSTHITDYEISPQELGEKTQDTTLFRKKAENEFLAVWHTHPHSSSHPSSIDVNNCLFERDYVIYSVADDDITIFRLSKGIER